MTQLNASKFYSNTAEVVWVSRAFFYGGNGARIRNEGVWNHHLFCVPLQQGCRELPSRAASGAGGDGRRDRKYNRARRLTVIQGGAHGRRGGRASQTGAAAAARSGLAFSGLRKLPRWRAASSEPRVTTRPRQKHPAGSSTFTGATAALPWLKLVNSTISLQDVGLKSTGEGHFQSRGL